MTLRLGLVTVVTVGVALIVVACGSSESAVDGAGDGGGASSGSSGASGGVGSGGACDATMAAACGTTRKCDANLGCVECVIDGDCTAAGRDPFCILGRCEACRTNTDCGVAAPACYPGDHQCHRSCLGDGGVQCGQGGQGGQGNGTNAPICDQTTGACIGCNVATDCPATAPICEPTTKSCVSCTTNADCPAARPKCRAPRFQCAECIVTADCGAGRVCSGDGQCEAAGCTNDQACAATPQTPKCNVLSGRCSQCLTATDCTAVANRPMCATTGDEAGRCVQCVRDSDCNDGGGGGGNGLQCDNGLCK